MIKSINSIFDSNNDILTSEKENEDKERYQELEEQLNKALVSLSKNNGNLNEYLIINDARLDKEDKTDAVEKEAK